MPKRARLSGRRSFRRSTGHCVIGAVKRAFGCAAFLSLSGRPVVALPVDGVRRRLAVHAFPPDVAVVGQRDVGEDRVFLDRLHRVRIRLVIRAGRDAEKSGFRVDGVKLAVLVGLDPGDVVADGRHFPAFFLKRFRRNEHREIRFAAGRRESGADVIFAAVGRFHADDQHVFGEPALLASERRSDAQSEAFFAEQRVAAVARAVAARSILSSGKWTMYLSFGSGEHGHATSSWPSASGIPTECRQCTNSPSPSASSALLPMRVMIFILTTTYGESEICTPNCEIGEPIGPMQNGMTYIVRPFIEPSNFGVRDRLHLLRVHPVVGRAGVAFAARADVGAVFDARDVRRVRARQKRIRALFLRSA